MRPDRRKTALVFWVIVSIVLGFCGVTGCGRPSSAEKIDKQILGTWSEVKPGIQAFTVLTLNPDGSFSEFFQWDTPAVHSCYFQHTTGKYKALGEDKVRLDSGGVLTPSES